MSEELDKALAWARNWMATASEEEKKAMYAAQRESWSKGPHGPTDGMGTTYLPSSPPQNDAGVEDDSEEAYQLGKREGYEEALADVDRRTGGDGEYFASTIPGRGCPDGHAMMAKIVGRFETRTPMSELQALGQEFEAGWRPIETMKLWEVGVVSDGELACVSQKAQGDFDEGDEHYFAIDPEDALEWQPTHWLPLPSAPSGEV